MAYNLPSVFFVKEIEGNSECILYESHKQDEIRSLDGYYNFNTIISLYLWVYLALIIVLFLKKKKIFFRSFTF